MKFSLEGHKVVTSKEMRRIETLAVEKGASQAAFVENAGRSIATIVDDYILSHALEHHATLVVGKGNNASDAYAAGAQLLAKGYSVVAHCIYPLASCGPLCQEQHERFKKAGGKIHFLREGEKPSFLPKGIVLDGLVGSGFHGAAEGALADAISAINKCGRPVLSIDIPSGLDGDNGIVASVAVAATATIYLGLPKIGFFVGEGWNHVGELIAADFGLETSFIAQAKAEAHLLEERALPALLPPIKRNRHKYEAGYLLALAGSEGMSGAAILSSYAALRSGAGVVRLFHPPGEGFENAPYELIKEMWDLSDDARFYAELKRASAMMIGPGLGRSKEIDKLLKKAVASLHLPSVLDADALYFLSEHPNLELPAECILTPHRREMERLLQVKSPYRDESELLAACQEYVDRKKTLLVLKGAPTFIFAPHELPLVIPRGDPGMATAGTGDVLTGIIGALLAQQATPKAAATLGVAIHALSGEAAAREKSSYCLVASDLIHHLPGVFLNFLRFHHPSVDR